MFILKRGEFFLTWDVSAVAFWDWSGCERGSKFFFFFFFFFFFSDSFLPRVCELATTSSVRQTKVRI